MDPGRILAGRFAGKPIHGTGVALEECDAVTQRHLKRSEGTLLAPVVEQFLGVVKAAEDDQSLGGVRTGCRHRRRRMSDGPLELLQGFLRLAPGRIADTE